VAELQVGIRADTRGARTVVRSLNQIKQAARGTTGSLQATSAAAGQTTTSYTALNGQTVKVAKSQNLASTASKGLSSSLTNTTRSANALTTAEKAATTQTNLLTGAMARFQAAAASAFGTSSAGAARFASQARIAAGNSVGLSTGAAGLGAAIAVGLGVGVKSAVEFETTLSRIEGLVGIAADEVEAFKKPLLDIAKATAKGPNELAEALFFVTSAGFEGKEALDVLEASAKAAAAGLGETKTVADAVTSAVNAYGIENLSASRATDILVATVREGKAEADSIAGALGQVLPAASELGVEFEELGGTIAALTRIGLNAEQGTTALTATLSAIQKFTPAAEEELAKFGTSASEVRKKVRDEGLLEALQDLQQRFGDNETALTKVFPNIRAIRAILPLVGKNAGDVANIFKEVAADTDAANAAFEVYAKTSGFTLNESLVVLQTTLIKLGDDLLPAVTKAFVEFVAIVEGAVDGLKAFSENIAIFFSGADDPIERAKDQLEEVNDAIRALERSGSGGARLNDLFGIEVGNIELAGSLEDQLELLDKEKKRLEQAIDLNEELLDNKRKQKEAAEAAAKAAEEQAKAEKDAADAAAATQVRIDLEALDTGKKELGDLRKEIEFLESDLANLQEFGQEGIGLAEDFGTAAELAAKLQGQTQFTAEDLRTLLEIKRDLQDEIALVTEEFQKQEAAVSFIDDLVMSTDMLKQKLEALQSDATIFDIDSLQQAQQIFDDLSQEDRDKFGFGSPEDIQAQIQLQEALNTAIGEIPVDKVRELNSQLEVLRAEQANVDPESNEFAILAKSATDLEQAIINAALAKEGLDDLDTIILEALPKEEQFEQASERLRKAFDMAGIVDPDQNPDFLAALDKLEEKINGTGDAMSEFGIQAARNLQSAFADFLFDPLDEGFDGMLKGFAETLKRMAAEALSAQILQSLFGALGGAGGGGGYAGFFNALAGAFGGGLADGGPVQPGKTFLVGERGPELFQPNQSGNIVSNEMMRGAASAPPQVNVAPAPVVVVDDPSKVEKALQTADGQRALVNAITEKRGSIKQALQ
jgi:TP901 family phage tail tape measure protein